MTVDSVRFEFDGFHLDLVDRSLWRGNARISLPPRAFATLCHFVRHPGRVLTKRELMDAVWPDAPVEENNLNQTVSTLRRVLGTSDFIVTVPGHGYRFVPLVRAGPSDRADPTTLSNAPMPMGLTPVTEPVARVGPGLHRLRSPVSSFVGREQDLRAVVSLVRLGRRLVTIVGAGGVGKTRVALRVGQMLSGDFVDGVVAVALASVRDHRMIPDVLAQSIGVLEGREPPWTRVLTALRDQHVLLILDNFEHIVEAGPLLVELLETCLNVRVLVTSRVSLHLTGEQQMYLAPLAWPASTELLDVAAIGRFDAVRLFVERTRAVRPDFELSEENAAAVAGVCARVDGLPLAIELAAARTGVLPVSALLHRLDRRLPVLTNGARDQPARQHSMREAIAWSYELLAPAEQAVFRRLGVFSGGFELAAAEALFPTVAPSDGRPSVVDLLSVLVDGSLVSADGSDLLRFSMLETIREFALECLEAQGEEVEARSLHARHFASVAEQGDAELRGANQQEWLPRLEREHDNMRGALRWMCQQGDARMAQQLAGSLHWFWFLHSHFFEGRRWFDETFSLVDADAPGVVPSATLGAGILAYDQADYTSATAHLLRCIDAARSEGDGRALATALQFLGLVGHRQGRYDAIRPHLEESLDVATGIDDEWCIAGALCALGHSVPGVNSDDAREALERAAAIFRRLGDSWGLARAANSLGEHARARGDIEAAGTLYEESLMRYSALGNENACALVLHNLGCVAMQQGDWRGGGGCFSEALRLHRKHGDQRGVAHCLAGLAASIARCGAPEWAAPAFGCAERLFEVTESARDLVDEGIHDVVVAQVRATLGPVLADSLWANGRAASVGSCIDETTASFERI